MFITRETVEHIANLARLGLKEEEIELYTKQLQKILEYVEKLNELDTENVPPTFNVIGKVNALRKDELKPSLDRELLLKNAPKEEQNHFWVPKVIE